MNQKTPTYQRIKQAILSNIHAGVWQVGTAIPTEIALCEQFGVSRMTVNRALKELTEERVLVRRQGSGTFVAQHKYSHPFIEIRNIAQAIQAEQKRYHAKVLSQKLLPTCDLGAHIGHDFEILPKVGDIFWLSVVHYADDVPVQLEERWVDASLVPDFGAQDFSQINSSEFLVANTPFDVGQYSIAAKSAPDDVANALQMPTGAPALLLSRQTWSQGRMVTAVNMWHVGERYQFSGTL